MHSFQSVRSQLKTARDAETCFTCHQQIRAKGLRTSHHPVREGKIGCGDCHDPHEGTKPKMLKTEWITETCLTCHTEKRGPFLWEHAPVRENCALCHDPHGSNHDKLLVAKQPFLCQRCHLNTRHPGTLYDETNTSTGRTTGGTGITARDGTFEVASALIEKPLPGFGELFRMLSYQEIGAAAMLSRACAGRVGAALLVCLPGSEHAVRLAMTKLIVPELGHLVREVSR